ncbi:MAG TPA: uracil-DNA glycosylase family protein, partial [Rhodothermia bacterium]
QEYHLDPAKRTLTEVVRGWRDHWPEIVPMPHPSPRNNIWLRKHAWFEEELVPALQAQVRKILDGK